MNNTNTPESGMTLVELIGAIVILFIISGLAFPIIMTGLKTANTIQREAMFRNEADYLMAAFVKDIFITKETDIVQVHFPDKNTPTNYYILKKDNSSIINGNITGFKDNKLFVSGREINTKNNSIKLLPSSMKLIGDGEYEIILWLQMNGEKTKKMEFKNVIRTINDKEEES